MLLQSTLHLKMLGELFMPENRDFLETLGDDGDDMSRQAYYQPPRHQKVPMDE